MGQIDLTEKQLKVLSFIVNQARSKNHTPSWREISIRFGFKSTGGAKRHLDALERKGYLTRSGTHRGMEIVWDKVWQVLGIPLLSKVPAGNPRLPSAEQLGMLTPNELYPYGEGIYSLQVHGDSMKDAGIHDGDIVLVQEQYEAKHGDIVVAVIENDESEGEMTVKRLVHRKGKHYLEPANPYYKPIELNGGKIVGVVIQVIRKLKK